MADHAGRRDMLNPPKDANVIGLEFAGTIVNGRGHHAELGIPGGKVLANAAADWPKILFPGSLNFKVKVYPAEFKARRLPPSTQTLDTAGFVPEFIIGQDLMKNNKIDAHLVDAASRQSSGLAQPSRGERPSDFLLGLRRLGSRLTN